LQQIIETTCVSPVVLIPVTRRVTESMKHVEGSVFDPIKKKYILDLDHYPSRSSHVRLSVCLSVRMNAEISETIKARMLGLGMSILQLLA